MHRPGKILYKHTILHTFPYRTHHRYLAISKPILKQTMSSPNNASTTIITTERIQDIVCQVMCTALETQARPGTAFFTEAETTVPSFGPVHITQIVRETITTATLPEGTVAITPNCQQVLITDHEENTAIALTCDIDPVIAETLGIALPSAANRYQLIQEALASTPIEEEEEEDDHDTILHRTLKPCLPMTLFNSVDREVISDPEIDFDPNNPPELQESIRQCILDTLHVEEEEEEEKRKHLPRPHPLNHFPYDHRYHTWLYHQILMTFHSPRTKPLSLEHLDNAFHCLTSFLSINLWIYTKIYPLA